MKIREFLLPVARIGEPTDSPLIYPLEVLDNAFTHRTPPGALIPVVMGFPADSPIPLSMVAAFERGVRMIGSVYYAHIQLAVVPDVDTQGTRLLYAFDHFPEKMAFSLQGFGTAEPRGPERGAQRVVQSDFIVQAICVSAHGENGISARGPIFELQDGEWVPLTAMGVEAQGEPTCTD
jgi:hypothetical protein